MKYKRNRGGFFHTFWGAVLGGTLTALGVGLALMVVFSICAMGTEKPVTVAMPLGLIALAIAMLACGYTVTRLWGHPSPVPALTGGALLSVFLVACGLCFPGSTLPVAIRLAGGPVATVLSVCGGLIATKRGKKRRHHA